MATKAKLHRFTEAWFTVFICTLVWVYGDQRESCYHGKLEIPVSKNSGFGNNDFEEEIFKIYFRNLNFRGGYIQPLNQEIRQGVA